MVERNSRPPLWMRQAMADIARHEGFREFAYPDPLSPIGSQYQGRKWEWGFKPGDILLGKYGLRAADGTPWTVGYGFTHRVTPATRISKQAADHLLEQVILDHMYIVDRMVPNWRSLPLFAQSVVINMAFNLGTRLYQFKNSMSLISRGEYSAAAASLKKSLWARQVKGRAVELISRLERRAIEPQHRVPV